MKQQFITFAFFGLCFASLNLNAQFAAPVGQAGTTAIFKDSSVFVGWASQCKVIRGLQDISVPSAGYANVGDSSLALGLAGTNGVVSLGDGGMAILQFNRPISDGVGPDFAVFENSFDDQFLELAFVEVSSDGVNYFRFPAVSNTDTITQTWSFGLTDATKINNLAGKYKAEYGTPFDLLDIADHILLDKQSITHIKVIDVVGCIQNQYCMRDVNHHIINDPWPTAFGSGGFDLDAVGVIHQKTVGVEEFESQHVSVYPNPVKDELKVSLAINTEHAVVVKNMLGETILEEKQYLKTTTLDLSHLKSGVYFLTIISEGKLQQLKFMKE
jgi:hypothetical protein